MTTIWKYPVPLQDIVRIDMPAGAKVIAVQTQKGIPCIWAIVDPDRPISQRTFWWRGTGHPLPDEPLNQLGTIQVGGGELVFHLFGPSDPS